MKTTNMGGGYRACVFLLVLCVKFQLMSAKPFFGLMWCDLWCDDDDYDDISTTSTSTTTTLDDLLDLFDPCSGCPTRRPTTRRPPTPIPGMMPFNFWLPPNGMNMTMSNVGGSYVMQMFPTGGMPATPAPAATPAPTTAGTTAATTAAADANATTAAPSSASP